jgi:hypothetical protein
VTVGASSRGNLRTAWSTSRRRCQLLIAAEAAIPVERIDEHRQSLTLYADHPP